MRKIRRITLVAILLVAAAILGLCAAIVPKERPIDCGITTSVVSLTVKSTPISVAQMEVAETIAEVALEEFDADDVFRAAEIGVMTATQESTLGVDTTPEDGSSSDGPFQQIEAWGPLADRRDITKSTRMFFTGGQDGQPGLQDIENWQSLSRGDAAQRVQGSGFPDAYDQHEVESIAIVARIFGNEVTSTAQDCAEETIDPIEAMVLAALSRVDDPIQEVSSSGSPARIASFNVLGSNHTSQESAMSRIETQAALIQSLRLGVVGLQELRADQRARLLKLTDGQYEIYPRTEVYGDTQLSVNSIIWDTSQFELVDAKPTPMPYYYNGNRFDIPQVELRYLDSGTVITVINTHDPAGAADARTRYLNAQAHADLTDDLTASGSLVFFTGDFNSGYGVRDAVNTTYQGARDNLTWCVMTRSGVAVNGYDDKRGRTGCPALTTSEMGVGPVDHVYVPKDGVETTDYRIIKDGTASDHPLVYAEVTFDGAATDSGSIKTSPQFVQWAADQAGFVLPGTFGELSDFVGSSEDGVTGKLISAAEIAAGETLERGDLVIMNDDTVGIFTGSAVGGGQSFRVSTYNLQVGAGYQVRIDAAEELRNQYSLDAIGYQEVENKAMFDAMASKSFLGERYAIYPEQQPPGMNRNSLGARPIVYDTTRFRFVSGSFFEFRRMHLDDPDQPAQFPILRLEDRITGQQVVFMNSHQAAYRRYAKERWEAGKVTTETVKQQNADSTPVILLTDANSQHFVRSDSPNPTYQDDRDNLLYCQLTENGLMNNARDLAETDPRFKPGSYCPRQQGDGPGTVDHIYLSSELDVPDGGYGEMLGTQTDHGKALFADVTVVGANVAPGEESLGTYVGLSPDKRTVALRSVNPDKLVRTIRLTVLAFGGEWVFPLQPGVYNYSSPYGPRDLGDDNFHNGADFGTQGVEAPLVAMHAGTVTVVGESGAWGNYLVVETGIPVPGLPDATYKYMYAHLSAFADGLAPNQAVTAGQFVGNVGDTGNSHGEHLHLNICTTMECTSGNAEGAIDPIPFLASVGITP